MNIRFQKYEKNPIIPKTEGTFYSKYSANPDVLLFGDKYFLYFRGQDETGHDQIGVAFVYKKDFNGINWTIPEANPIIKIAEPADEFDSGYILDPASIIVKNKIFLYYTAHRRDWQSWNIPSYIGLAISEDGFHFNKYKANPLIEGMAPEVLEFKNQIYLFYQRINSNHGFDIFCCRSSDGLHFSINNEKRIFSESNNLSAFDAVSVSTVRIWREENWFFMVYGGGNKFRDYPLAFGLARSRDLLNWERYPHNPILLRGKPGNWDEGAVWFGTVYKHKGTYYLWYEGTGTGLPLTNANAIEKSRQCREEDYGGYGINSFSQIGLATFAGDIAKWD